MERQPQGKGGSTHDDGDIEYHIGDITSLRDPERVDQLAESSSEGVSQAHDSRSSDTPAVGKPHVRVSSGSGEDKGLGEADDDLAGHGVGNITPTAAGGSRVADPVADEDEGTSDDEGQSQTPMQNEDGEGEDGDKGQEKCCADPVDGGLGDIVVFSRGAGNGSKGEPLLMFTIIVIDDSLEI